MLKEISPVGQLLEQWLLLPFFAHVGMMILVLRATRGRAGVSLSALLALFALMDIAAIWPGAGLLPRALVVCKALVPAMVAAFDLSYAAGRRLPGQRIYLVLFLLVPSLSFAAMALAAGWTALDPAIPIFSLAFFGANIAFLVLSGGASSLGGDEPVLLGAGITLIVISGPVLDLVLPPSASGLPLFPYASAAAGALFAWATVRYLAFSAVEPIATGRPSGPPPTSGVFLEKQKEPGRARAIFINEVRNGIGGIAVSRTNPAAMRRQTGIANLPVIWLAQSSFEKCLPPASLEVLAHALRDLGNRGQPCIVLVEDLDYLLTNAGEFRTLDFLGNMKRISSGAKLTICLSSDLLTEDERSQIRNLGVRPLSCEIPA